MAKVLKQDEVDALLNLVQQVDTPKPETPATDEPAAETAGETGEPTGYNVLRPESVYIFDFKRPERVSRDQVTALEALHEVFARNVSATLSGYLRTLVEFRLISVEQFTYSEFTMSVPTPTIFSSLTCSPLVGHMILDMNPAIIYPFIDRLLGGGSVKPYHINRPFTLIEQCLINSIITKLLDQLRETWLAIIPISFRIGEMETNPSLMQIVPPNEPVILLSFEVNMGEHSGLVNLCIPFKVIETVIEKFSHQTWSMFQKSKSLDDGGDILDNIRYSEVDISVILAEMRVRMVDILNMQPGDILDCGKRADDHVALAVGDEKTFKGEPATHKNHYALVVRDLTDNMRAMFEARDEMEANRERAKQLREQANHEEQEAKARAEREEAKEFEFLFR